MRTAKVLCVTEDAQVGPKTGELDAGNGKLVLEEIKSEKVITHLFGTGCIYSSLPVITHWKEAHEVNKTSSEANINDRNNRQIFQDVAVPDNLVFTIEQFRHMSL